MNESKNSSIPYNPLDALKQEINLRHRIMQYKKLHQTFFYRCFEKNNVEHIYDTIKDLK